jgi:hypothetical protein
LFHGYKQTVGRAGRRIRVFLTDSPKACEREWEGAETVGFVYLLPILGSPPPPPPTHSTSTAVSITPNGHLDNSALIGTILSQLRRDHWYASLGLAAWIKVETGVCLFIFSVYTLKHYYTEWFIRRSQRNDNYKSRNNLRTKTKLGNTAYIETVSRRTLLRFVLSPFSLWYPPP